MTHDAGAGRGDPVRHEHDGLALWWGTDDAPAPAGVAADRAALLVGLWPASPTSLVRVHYRVDDGPLQVLRARPVRADARTGAGYYRAEFPPLPEGAAVRYGASASCAGRRVPADARALPGAFRLRAPAPAPAAAPAAEGRGGAEPCSPFALEYLGTADLRLNRRPEVIGVTPAGLKADFFLLGGTMAGPRLTAAVRAGGGDWMLVRPDGIGAIDARLTLETADGALIYVAYTGVADFGEDGYERFLRKRWPPTPPMRVAPRYLTADARYAWLNRLQCVGVGHVHMDRLAVHYDVYAVR